MTIEQFFECVKQGKTIAAYFDRKCDRRGQTYDYNFVEIDLVKHCWELHKNNGDPQRYEIRSFSFGGPLENFTDDIEREREKLRDKLRVEAEAWYRSRCEDWDVSAEAPAVSENSNVDSGEKLVAVSFSDADLYKIKLEIGTKFEMTGTVIKDILFSKGKYGDNVSVSCCGDLYTFHGCTEIVRCYLTRDGVWQYRGGFPS